MTMDENALRWLKLVKTKPVAFGIETGFTDLTELHNEWIKKFLFEKEDMTLQAHRGSYKTTCLSIAIALMIVLFPKKNIIFMRKSDDDVKEIIDQVAKLLLTGIFQDLAHALYGTTITLHKQTAYEISTNLKATTKGRPQLLGLGIRSSITGKHADIMITDDIVNFDDRVSKAGRTFTKNKYQELQNVKNRGGRFINTGTPWHKDDAFKLMPSIIRYDCYSTGLIEDKALSELRASMTPSLFAANYELKHISDEETIFPHPKRADSDELVYDGVCHIDAAYGGSDYTAFTILKQRGDKIYVTGKMWRKHIDECIPLIKAYRKHYRAGTLYVESNADKGYVAKQFEHPKKSYHESMNKYMKISTNIKPNWANIYFTPDTDDEYIEQIESYNELADHDDAPDSLASLIRVAVKTNSDDGKIRFIKGGIV